MHRTLLYKAVTVLMILSVCVSPVFAQVQQNAPAPTPSGPPPARQVTLGMDYSSGKKWYPISIRPYTPLQIVEPALTNSQRVAQLIQSGKLMLSLDDAISLALEDNLAIAVERYAPWLDQVSLLRAKSGVGGPVLFDPTLSGNINLEESNTPLNNPLFAGVIPTSVTTPTQSVPPPISSTLET